MTINSLDIDDALAAEIEAAAKLRGMTLRDFIRAALRQAVSMPAPLAVPGQFVQRVHDFGVHVESPWTVLADLETDEYAQKLTRK